MTAAFVGGRAARDERMDEDVESVRRRRVLHGVREPVASAPSPQASRQTAPARSWSALFVQTKGSACSWRTATAATENQSASDAGRMRCGIVSPGASDGLRARCHAHQKDRTARTLLVLNLKSLYWYPLPKFWFHALRVM